MMTATIVLALADGFRNIPLSWLVCPGKSSERVDPSSGYLMTRTRTLAQALIDAGYTFFKQSSGRIWCGYTTSGHRHHGSGMAH